MKKNNNRLVISRNKYYTSIEICYDDNEDIDVKNSIVEFLRCSAKGKKVFVEYYGNNTELDDTNNVIKQKTDAKSAFRKKLWMRDTWLSITDKSFFEERYTMIFLFEEDCPWEAFLENSGSDYRIMKMGSHLLLCATFGEGEFPCLYLQRGDHLEDSALDYFENKGFEKKYRV